MKVLTVSTSSKVEFIDVTDKIERAIKDCGVKSGVCWAFVPHTTAAITINEGADPSVRTDIINQLEKIAPPGSHYTHREGNSPAHIKASILGPSEMIIVEEGRLRLGTWQCVYFGEFDGPRTRKLMVKVIGE